MKPEPTNDTLKTSNLFSEKESTESNFEFSSAMNSVNKSINEISNQIKDLNFEENLTSNLTNLKDLSNGSVNLKWSTKNQLITNLIQLSAIINNQIYSSDAKDKIIKENVDLLKVLNEISDKSKYQINNDELILNLNQSLRIALMNHFIKIRFKIIAKNHFDSIDEEEKIKLIFKSNLFVQQLISLPVVDLLDNEIDENKIKNESNKADENEDKNESNKTNENESDKMDEKKDENKDTQTISTLAIDTIDYKSEIDNLKSQILDIKKVLRNRFNVKYNFEIEDENFFNSELNKCYLIYDFMSFGLKWCIFYKIVEARTLFNRKVKKVCLGILAKHDKKEINWSIRTDFKLKLYHDSELLDKKIKIFNYKFTNSCTFTRLNLINLDDLRKYGYNRRNRIKFGVELNTKRFLKIK